MTKLASWQVFIVSTRGHWSILRWRCITVMSHDWPSVMHLMSQETWLFVQQLFRLTDNKASIKAKHHWSFVRGKPRHYWPFVRGIHQLPAVDSPHKGPVTWIAFPYHAVTMAIACMPPIQVDTWLYSSPAADTWLVSCTLQPEVAVYLAQKRQVDRMPTSWWCIIMCRLLDDVS